MRLLLPLVVLTAAMLCLPARGDPPPADALAQLKDQEIQNATREAAKLPSLGEMAVDQIMRVSIQDGWIVATTPLRPTDRLSTVTLVGMPVFARLNVRLQPGNVAGRSTAFELMWVDYSDPTSIDLQMQVLVAASSELFSVDQEWPQRSRSIQFIENFTTGIDAGASLFVQDFNSGSDVQPMPLRVTGRTFAELRYTHPGPVDEFVRPMFRQLRQERAVFTPDLIVARQVLREQLKPDPALVATVNELVARLDAEQYSQRAAAVGELQKLGAPAAEVLMRMDTSRMSEEQKTRLSTLCTPFEPLTAEQMRDFGSDVQFLLDCLYVDDSAVRAAAAGRLEKVTGRPLDIDVTAAPQARYAAINRLRGVLAPTPTTNPGAR